MFVHLQELETEVVKKDETLLDYIDTLKHLKQLDHLCNSETLNYNYKEVIENFSDSWLKLKENHGTTITNKVHIIMEHLGEYFYRSGSTLKYASDQVVESSHQEFSKRMDSGNYNVKNFKAKNMEKNF